MTLNCLAPNSRDTGFGCRNIPLKRYVMYLYPVIQVNIDNIYKKKKNRFVGDICVAEKDNPVIVICFLNSFPHLRNHLLCFDGVVGNDCDGEFVPFESLQKQESRCIHSPVAMPCTVH